MDRKVLVGDISGDVSMHGPWAVGDRIVDPDGNPITIGTSLANIRYVGPNGSDVSGDGSDRNPYSTIQKAYDDMFPSGYPTSWADFEKERIIIVLPGVDDDAVAQDLYAVNVNLTIKGQGELGEIVYDSKQEIYNSWSDSPSEYGMNTLAFVGDGFGYDSSSAHPSLKIDAIYLANDYNAAGAEVLVEVNNVQCSIYTQKRGDAPGGSWNRPIYVNAYDAMFTYIKTGQGTDARAGAVGLTFTRLHDCLVRNQVDATNGAVGIAEMDNVYFRKGFKGDPAISNMISAGVFRGWRDCYFKTGIDFTGITDTLYMDTASYLYMLDNCSITWGTVSVEIVDGARIGNTANRPHGGKGLLYYDTDLSKLLLHNGTSWVDYAAYSKTFSITGGSVSISGDGATATVTHSGHNLLTNQTIVVAGTSNFNGGHIITFVDASTYTFPSTYTGGPEVGTVTITDPWGGNDPITYQEAIDRITVALASHLGVVL